MSRILASILIASALGVTTAAQDARPALPALPSTAPWVGAQRVGNSIPIPVRVSGANPVYPEDARLKRIEDVVMLDALVGVDGHVQAVRMNRSVPAFDAVVVEAVHKWRYAPTLIDGKPTPVVLFIGVRFSLTPLPASVPSRTGESINISAPSSPITAAPPPATPAPPATAATPVWPPAVGAIRAGGTIKPQQKKTVQPRYTQAAKDARVQGSVVLEIVIDTDGKVRDARVRSSTASEFGS